MITVAVGLDVLEQVLLIGGYGVSPPPGTLRLAMGGVVLRRVRPVPLVSARGWDGLPFTSEANSVDQLRVLGS
jgi:hypothetical protein